MTRSLDAAGVLKEARQWSGLSQRALARRAGTSQSVVARIELGQTSPSVSTLSRLLAVAGFEVRAELRPRGVADSHMLEDVPRILRLTPEERLLEVANVSRFEKSVVSEVAPFDPERIITTLAKHGVEYVLVGALGRCGAVVIWTG